MKDKSDNKADTAILVLTCAQKKEPEGKYSGNVPSISIGNKTWKINQVARVSHDQDQLLSILHKAKNEKKTLIFRSLSDLKKEIDLLELIHTYSGPFLFQDLPAINSKKALSVLISYLTYEHELKSRKIKKALQKKKEEGKEVGNLEIGKPEGIATRRRQLEAFSNDENIKARIRIDALREKQKLNYNQIAKKLNEEGLKPRRGSKFYARTVMRIKESKEKLYQKYKSALKPDEELEILSYGNRNGSATTSPLQKIKVDQLENGAEFHDKLEFSFIETIPTEFEISIIDNHRKLVFKKEFPANKKNISIDLKKNALFGLHYISIRQKGKSAYLPFVRSVILMKDLLDEYQ